MLFYFSLSWEKNSSRSLLGDFSVLSDLSGSSSVILRGETGLLGGQFSLTHTSNGEGWWGGLARTACQSVSGMDALSSRLGNQTRKQFKKGILKHCEQWQYSWNGIWLPTKRTSSCPRSIGLLKQTSRNLISHLTYLILSPLK